MTTAREVVLGLGANLGSRCATLRAALELLTSDGDVDVVTISPFYETAPVGPPQPSYVNAAARVRTSLSLEALLARTLSVERALGRRRTDAERWGPRLVDVDVLWAFGETIATDALTVPHPRLGERAFALFPLLDVAPEARETLADRVDAVGGRPPVIDAPTVVVHDAGPSRRVRATAADPDDALAFALAALYPADASRGLTAVEPPILGEDPASFLRALLEVAAGEGFRLRAVSAVIRPPCGPALRLVGCREGAPDTAEPTEATVVRSNGRFVASLSVRIGNSRTVAK